MGIKEDKECIDNVPTSAKAIPCLKTVQKHKKQEKKYQNTEKLICKRYKTTYKNATYEIVNHNKKQAHITYIFRKGLEL